MSQNHTPTEQPRSSFPAGESAKAVFEREQAVLKKQTADIQRLADRMGRMEWSESLAEELLAAREAGVDFTQRLAKKAGARGVAAPKISLLKNLFQRQEAQETLAGATFNYVQRVQVDPDPGAHKNSQEAIDAGIVAAMGETEEARDNGVQTLADIVNAGNEARKALAATTQSLGEPQTALLRELMKAAPGAERLYEASQVYRQFAARREQWERLTERILSVFSLRELLTAGVEWSQLMLAPLKTRDALLKEAKEAPVLWVDESNHTPLSALSLMSRHVFSPEERTALLADLREALAPAASPNENNPFFALVSRARDTPLDEEMCRALRAAGLSPSTPGRDGVNAIDLARDCIGIEEGMQTGFPHNAGREDLRDFWEKAFARLEHEDLLTQINPARSVDTKKIGVESSGAIPVRASRRI